MAEPQPPELAEPWKVSVARYQHLRGVHQPWIAEISPFQLGQMSKRQRDAYGKKREAEWAASGQCKTEYRAAVVAAFDAGRFTLKDPEAHDDAKQAVSWALQDRRKADAEGRLKAALRENVPPIEDLEVGDRVFSVLGSFYGSITKKNARSVRIKPDKPLVGLRGDDFKADVGAVQWLHYNEVKRAVEAGLPIRPARLLTAAKPGETWTAHADRLEREAQERQYRCRGCKTTGKGSGFYLLHFTECPSPPPSDEPEMDMLEAA